MNTRPQRTGRLSMLPVAIACCATQQSWGASYTADPSASSGPNYYRTLVANLQPGDTLTLPAGTYSERLDLSGLHGTSASWITITGPASGAPAIITTQSNCCNAVQLGDTAYVAIKNLTVDANSEGVGESIDAVNAKGQPTHDILIDNCVIRGAALDQLTVGISTKSTAWNWVVRGSIIDGAGTGMYFGNSDGSAPFVAGVIENNLIVDTIGYNIEVKFQNPYTAPAGLPAGAQRTAIRHNVFIKRKAQAAWPADRVSGARPNVLVGGFPSSGTGATDLYEIYGNFFYQNADGESLLQASGRVSVHDNVFVAAIGSSVMLMDHDLPLKYADVYNNTVYLGQNGIRVASAARERSTVVGNLVFADSPISGTITQQTANITGASTEAAPYFRSPSTALGSMDFYPLPGQTQGAALDLSGYSSQLDFDRDFNGTSKGTRRYRGAYSGEGSNPGWQLDAKRKEPTGTLPAPPTNLQTD